MKLIQMQYSPDAFDSFIKGKLEEVEVDPALADKYWEQFSLEKKNLKPKDKKFNYKYLFIIGGISLFIIVSLLFYNSSQQSTTSTADEDLPINQPQMKTEEENKSSLHYQDSEPDNRSLNQSEEVEVPKNLNAEGSTKRTFVKGGDSKNVIETLGPGNTKEQFNDLTIAKEKNENMIQDENKPSQQEQVNDNENIHPDSILMNKKEIADKPIKKKRPAVHIIW